MKLTAIKYVLLMLFLIGCLASPLFAQTDDEDIHDLLYQRDFNSGAALPWQISEGDESYSDSEVIDGKLVLHVYNGGPDKWDVQIRHRELTLEQGHTYTVRFTLSASANTRVYAKIGEQAGNYTEYWSNSYQAISLTAGVPVTIEDTFTMTAATDDMVEFAFHAGGIFTGAVPLDIFFDDIHLEDPEYIRPKKDGRDKKEVRVNQHGYLPDAPKKATIVSASTSPLDWYLKNASGSTVLSGTTTVFGNDMASEDHVHIADFSAYTTEGTGYTLSIDGTAETAVSFPFDIAGDIYNKMKYDAFSYFYHNRSGIDIIMPYAGSSEYTRAAGHPSDTMTPASDVPNHGSYYLDVSKGWYDAGDHGKYVVNGGISVWTMMNQYERLLHVPGADAEAYADGAVNIPENNNGYPDILDESRWQMEMMLGFQVPEGYTYAGMAHHKGHDESWTGIPMAPADDPKQRYLRPVSTAATLNLAATAAQASRLWDEYDSAFADRCITAAERAWQAALDNPAIFAPVHKIGGGPYNDDHVEDEFYWAACELYLTTGKAEYKTHIETSEYYLNMPYILTSGEDDGLSGVFTWGATQGLGTLSLALVPGRLSAAEQQTARDSIRTSADYFLNLIENEGYRLPLNARDESAAAPGYPWGSNSCLVNDMIVMGYAYDYSQDKKYVDGMTETMDYLLGRNAMDQSYVTGYGEIAVQNPHHRFWAHQTDSSYPLAPAGCLSGGPNSGLEDPIVKGAGMEGTAPQKCFLDNIDSWSTNEITINWNAPFSWVTGFLDEERNGGPVLSVKLTAPADGARLDAGDILLTATTTGDAASVNFYDGTLLLGSDDTASFSYNWQNVTAGTYSIKARVFDTAGNFADSEVANITIIDNYKPSVTLTAPFAGQTFGLSEEVLIETVAEDLDGAIVSVAFTLNGEPLHTATSYPYSYNAGTLPAGQYTVTAVALDDDGAYSDAASVSFSVGEVNGFPIPGKIEVEEYEGFYDKSAGNYSGAYRTDDVDIEYCGEGGYNIAHIDAGEWLEYTVIVAETGKYDIESRTARDMSGEGSFHLEINGTDVSGSIAAPYTGNWQGFETYTTKGVSLTAGTYTLRVVFDAGSFNLNWLNFIKVPDDKFPPTVTLSSPQDGQTITVGDLITLNAAASDVDGTVEKVDFAIVYTDPNGAESASVMSDTSSLFSYSFPGAEGSYRVTATAYDDDDLFGTSPETVTVTVDKISQPSDLVVQTLTTQTDASSNQIAGKFNIVNKGTTGVNLTDLTIRYYYTKEKEIGQQFNCYWATIGLSNVHGAFKTENGRHFLEVSFTGGSVAAGSETGEIQYAVNNADWSNFNQSNDDSFTTRTSFADNELVELYQNGSMVWPESGPKEYDPAVTITAPVTGTTVQPGSAILVEATATDANGNETVSGVDFYDGSVHLGEGVKNGTTYTIAIPDAVDGKVYNLNAVAADTTGRTGDSNLVVVTCGTPTQEFTLTVSITADDGQSKTVVISPASKEGIREVSGVSGTTRTLTYDAPAAVTLTANGVRNWSGVVNGSNSTVSFTGQTGQSYTAVAGYSQPGQGDWLYTTGSKIYDKNGKEVWLTGANWFGFNCTERVFHGLYSVNLEDSLNAMADRGFNILRVPISTELLKEWKNGIYKDTNVNFQANPNMQGLNSLQIFDYIVDYCDSIGMKILLDVHSALADNSGHVAPMWYNGSITAADFVDSWVWFANRYKDNDTIVAYDLENEPHGKPWDPSQPFARWDDSNHQDNWKKVAQDTALAILAVNPNPLILVEGIESYPKAGKDYSSRSEADYYNNWWGGNLRGVRDFPIDLGQYQNKLVYSPHDYGPIVYKQPWFDEEFTAASQQQALDILYEKCWKDNWSFILEDGIAPLLIGEWGGKLDGGDNEKYMKAVRDYIVQEKIHHTFWCFNPNSGDTNGLVIGDWKTWNEVKYAIVEPSLWKVGGKFVGLSQDTNLGSNGTCVGNL